MSSASAMRTAGRGAALRPTRDIPLTRLRPLPALRSPPSEAPPPPPSAGRGHTTPSGLARSALAESVMSRNDMRRARRARPAFGETPRHELELRRGPAAPTRHAVKDWYSSAERAEALEAFRVAGRGVVQKQVREDVPFAWADFDQVLVELPDGHWANSYVANVARSIEGNATISPREKESLLNETLEMLSALSSIKSGDAAQLRE